MLEAYKLACVQESRAGSSAVFWGAQRSIVDKVMAVDAVGPFRPTYVLPARRADWKSIYFFEGDSDLLSGLTNDEVCTILTPQGNPVGQGSIVSNCEERGLRTMSALPQSFYLYLGSNRVSNRSLESIPDWPPERPFEEPANYVPLDAIPSHYLMVPHVLDEVAARAFQGAIAGNPLYGVKGPPGTGKTSLLARVATYLAQEKGLKVLVVAKAHKAVDNALTAVAEYSGTDRQFPVFRKTSKKNDFLNSRMPDLGVVFWKKECELPSTGSIMGAVLDAQLGELSFDVIIVDEAGQVPMFVAATLASHGKAFVFFGDDAQLPPILKAHHIGDVALSAMQFILRRDRTNSYSVALQVTHRLNREICEIVSGQFYPEIGLRSSPANQESKILRISGEDCRDEPMARLVPISCRVSNTECLEELDVVEGLIQELLRADVEVDGRERPLKPADIAVLTPYRAQARKLRARMEPYKVRKVGTVDIMQGQSVAVVIMCITTTKPAHLSRRAEWLFQPNRLNVGISRAKAACYMLVNPQSIDDANPSTIEGVENLEMLKCLIRKLSLGGAQ